MDILQNTGSVIIYNIIPLIIVLGIMIFFHEMGHFLVAKFFNVKVLKFALGFGPKIISREYGETEYSIRYLPLGGFVKMLGENDFDEDADPIDEKDAERAFNVQHPLKRIAIVAAGPVFNLVLAFLLFFSFFMFYGKPDPDSEPSYIPVIQSVNKGEPADRAGLQKNDLIMSVGEKDMKKPTDITESLEGKAGIPVKITVMRDDELMSFSVVPEEGIAPDEFGKEEKRALIGIGMSYKVHVDYLDIDPLVSIKESLIETGKVIKMTCLVVVKLFQGDVPLNTIGGPIMIGQITGQIVQKSIDDLLPFMAVISINLGILNLLPIPILDGGVILFLLFELVRRKPISMNKREFAMKIGLSLLLLLMVVVFYNDILRLFTK
ncbi:MAG: RIP metalloprotease RseP [Deltaproteobacteria bacterium]|nr:RIP metalloprotease RseP [Deltaproteobacteria bacterium]